MRKILSVFLLSFTLFTCNDGDIITVELDFDDTFKACGELVFYKTKSEPAESLSIFLSNPAVSLEDFLVYSFDEEDTDSITPILENPELTFIINGSANRFNYRTYNTEPVDFFCEDVPPADIEVRTDYESTDGTVVVTTVLLEDDNDGIPAWFEDENLDGDNDPSTNPTDTDGDGIPDYLDDDDDGDNIRTIVENPNFDETLGNLVDPQDSDGDGTPDYLDDDDDNDGVLTRDEENTSQDQNPLNDRTGNDEDDGVIDGVTPLDYLNPNIDSTVTASAYREHSIYQEFTLSIEINSIDLPILNQDFLDFGTLEDTNLSKTRTVTPEFP